jgi:hypothetical protein
MVHVLLFVSTLCFPFVFMKKKIEENPKLLADIIRNLWHYRSECIEKKQYEEVEEIDRALKALVNAYLDCIILYQ